MKTRKSVQKNPGQNQTEKVKKSEHVKIEADTFYLQAHLSQNQFTIILKDYVNWKVYNKHCSEQGLSQELGCEVNIQQLFSVLESDNKHPWIKPKLIHYKFGETLKRKNQKELVIKSNGKISLSIPSQKGKQTYELALYKTSQINKRDQLKINNQITKTQIEEDYDNEISELKTKNAHLEKELRRVQYLLYMSEYMRARSVKKQNEGEFTYQIFAKDLVGRTHTLDVKMTDTILKVKSLIQVKNGQCPEQQRLIYAGFQLDNQQTVASCCLRPQSTIHIVLRLKGSIGIFNEYINSQYRELLLNKGYQLKQDQVMNLIHAVNGNPQSKFNLKQVSINSEKLSTLIGYCNKCYADKLTEQSLENIEDFKLNLTISQICQFIGEDLFRQLEQMFNSDYNQIVMRRCQAYDKLIKFHTDAQQKTLQVSLNDDSEYVGGRLVFANSQGIHTPKRKAGTVTIHDNTIVHGVSLFESGTRYSLFLLKN